MPIKVEDLVRQILKEALRLGKTALPTTTMVKLLYLCEYEFFKLKRERLTSLKWFAFHFGPWAREIPKAIGDDSFIEREEKTIDLGKTAKLLRIDPYKLETENFVDDLDARVTVRNVVSDWSDVHLNTLLDYVYNQTEPMLNVDKKGDALDFDTIATPLVIPPYKPPKEEVERLRQRVKEAVQRRKELIEQAQKTKIPIKDPSVIKALGRLREPEHEKPIYASKVKGTSKYPSPYPQEK